MYRNRLKSDLGYYIQTDFTLLQFGDLPILTAVIIQFE